MADNCYGGIPLQNLFVALMGRLAVAAGALTALTSIWIGAPVHWASLRGASAWLLMLLTAKAFAALATRTAPQAATEADTSA